MTIGRTSVRIGFLILGLLSFTVGAEAKVVYVAKSGSDVNDGLSWTTAKVTVQAGLNTAAAGDEVWVAAGTYVECVTLPDGVALYGGFEGDETDISLRDRESNPTVLDGNAAGAVVTTAANATSTTRIDGFTIRNGNGTKGGGVYCASSFLTLANNLITANNATEGSGIYCDNSSPTITNNTITANNSTSRGGGVFCTTTSCPTITGNTITSNTTEYGGGVYCSYSSPMIKNNMIARNLAKSGGGGITCSCSATVTNNMIEGNIAGTCGGGIVCNSSPTIANNTIAANSAASDGGGIYCCSGSPAVTNNTIAGNNAAADGGGIYCDNSTPRIKSTIIAFNSSGIAKTGPDPLTMRSDCVFGNRDYNYSGLPNPAWGNDNISADPRLVYLPCGNLHIQPDSPCIDTGDDSAVQNDWTDVDGQSRIAQAHVDIGADESDGTLWPESPNTIVRVTPEGNDTNDGLSWSTAKRTIQTAIDTASTRRGEVWVKAGAYPERITLRPYVHVYGGFSGAETDRRRRDWQASISIVDGESQDSVVTAMNIGALPTTIDGFTIRNGRARCGGGVLCIRSCPTLANNTIATNKASDNGGGIYCCRFSSPSLANNVITANRAESLGGGIYWESTSPMADSVITDNSAGSEGGGLYYFGSSPMTIKNNTITRNTETHNGGGLFCVWPASTGDVSSTITGNTISNNSAPSGGGINCSCPVAITNNTITDNGSDTSTSRGGGISCSSSTVITNNMIARNRAANGGAIFCSSRLSVAIANNLIIGNKAYDGGGICCGTVCSPTITNNTISGNLATGSGGGVFSFGSSSQPTVTNTIIALNSSGIFTLPPSLMTLRSNCVYGNTTANYHNLIDPTGTDGNISVDPGFIRPPSPGADGQWATADDDAGDLHLKIGSPCIDAGNNSTVPEGILTDLDGRSRFFNDATALDSGVGTAPIVDMGAYESARPVPGDLNHDGDVDGNDLKAFVPCLRGQGLPYKEDCAVVDFDEDGDVDLSDFGLMQRCFSGVGQPVNPDCGV